MRKNLLTFDVSHLHTVKNSEDYNYFKPGGGALPPHLAPPPYTTAAATGWRSPIPYLFGGLAAMMGLIAFALLVLACSYLRLSGNFEDDAGDARDDKVNEAETKAKAVVVANSVLVIMAGDETPTFLATPAATNWMTLSVDDGRGGISKCSCSCPSSSVEEGSGS
ncbi:hypothetical protein vseg_000196 [Gypsophila vaccaria]